MKHAIDIMRPDPVTVESTLKVAELARLLLAEEVDGVCVVDDGKLMGVVTAMDLIFQERKVHLPTFLAIMDAIIPLGSKRSQDELAKITGSTVAEIMSSPVRTVNYDAALEAVAELMVEAHVSVVPVLREGKLVGVIGKRDLLQAMLAKRTND